ncbi:uncharacterized protein ACN2A1_014358 [Glossina fuscipes fuscipes]
MPRSQEVTPDRGVVQEFLTKLGGVAELTRLWCERVWLLCHRLSNIRDPACLRPKELLMAVLTGSSVIGDKDLQCILKSSSKLKLLNVRCCIRLTHESLIRLPACNSHWIMIDNNGDGCKRFGRSQV